MQRVSTEMKIPKLVFFCYTSHHLHIWNAYLREWRKNNEIIFHFIIGILLLFSDIIL